ncbi:MAG: hypothetical protein ACLGIR_07690 [Actinomycetes bacterium]
MRRRTVTTLALLAAAAGSTVAFVPPPPADVEGPFPAGACVRVKAVDPDYLCVLVYDPRP